MNGAKFLVGIEGRLKAKGNIMLVAIRSEIREAERDRPAIGHSDALIRTILNAGRATIR